MENALLYTFSTIAQALGGAFALLSAFVLFRFESLSQEMRILLREIRAILGQQLVDLQTFDNLQARGDFAALVQAIMEVVKTIRERKGDKVVTTIQESDLRTITKLKACAELQVRLKRVLKQAALMTGVVMLYTVALLPFAHLIHDAICWCWLLLAIGVAGFAACLWMYWAVIRVAIYSE